MIAKYNYVQKKQVDIETISTQLTFSPKQLQDCLGHAVEMKDENMKNP